MSTDAEEFLEEFDTDYDLVKEAVQEGVSLDMNRNVTLFLDLDSH
jgi:hypothetical protein